MSLSAPAYPLIVSVTQGSADAFVQGSVNTGLTGRQAYALRSLHWDWVSTRAAGASGNRFQIALSRRSKASFPTIADPDVIWMFDEVLGLVTSGVTVTRQADLVVFNYEIPIVEETLYVCVDSANTTVANNVVVRCEVELDTISDLDRLNLITRSLT